MTEVVLALGSNLGRREEYLEKALQSLAEGVEIEQVSSWFENAALGGPEGQGDFLNGALRGRTELSPEELLVFIKGIEQRLGRDLQAQRWSERVIDIDIIFYGAEVLDSTGLIIPHAQMHVRDFVLIPVCEIYPDYHHPVLGRSVLEILEDFGGRSC